MELLLSDKGVSVLGQILAMHWANVERERRGEAMAYDDVAFFNVASECDRELNEMINGNPKDQTDD